MTRVLFKPMLLLLLAGLVEVQAAGLSDFLKRKKSGAAKPPAAISFVKDVQPLLVEYCYDCHGDGMKKGGLALDAFPDPEKMLNDRHTWEMVINNVTSRLMPPAKKPQPTAAQRELIAAWIESAVFKIDPNHPDPGRVTIRRLNREEYNNTIRDLVGVNFKPAADFPADDAGYGFDNIGDVLSLSPLLLEKYLAAAEKILDQAIVTEPATNGPVKRLEAERLSSTAEGGPYGGWAMALNREGEVYTPFHFPEAGKYILRARAFGQQAGSDPARMEFRIEGRKVKVFDVAAVERAPKIYSVEVELPAGEQRFAAAYINNFRNPRDPNPDNRDRNLLVDYLEIVGPLRDGPAVLPETHRRIFTRQPSPETKREVARELIGNFAARAYRRPVEAAEVDRLMKLFELADKNGESFEVSVKIALEAALVSPRFLFRGELQPDPNNPKSVHPIDEYALASRLSYFLWSSMPDEELMSLAGGGVLRKNLEAQVRRMLRNSRSKALVENFAGQWLQLRNLDLVNVDRKRFPAYTGELRTAMRKETELFFEHVMEEDRSVLEFLNADYSFVNGPLARHYGIPGVEGEKFVKVSLRGTRRAGVLTHASVLTITSNPTRTSPVKRGLWVLDNLLAIPPPPPPPDVPPLAEDQKAAASGSLRDRLQKHREDPRCASCHDRMDPIGFGLENFDAIGAWRDRDENFPIDPAGMLVSGEVFSGPAELTAILVNQKKDLFIRCLAEKMLTYALGRGLEYYDRVAVKQIVKGMEAQHGKFSSLIMGVVNSTPFQQRRGEGDRLAESKP